MIFRNSFFIKTMQEIFLTEGRIGIGFSGGPDSLALILLVIEFYKENSHLPTIKSPEIFLFSMNHNIRKETSIEIEFVKKFASRHFLPIKIFHAEDSLNFSQTGNFHNKAHLWRYESMLSFCVQNSISVFLSAHHRDDQIETFFMRLKKGPGFEALCGIRSKKNFHTNFQEVLIFRPLLFISKNEILKFLSLKNQIYIFDRSNENKKYTRSKIRKNLKKEIFETTEFKKNFDLLIEKIWNTSDALNFYINKAFREFVFCENDPVCQIRFQIDSALFFCHPKETVIQIFKKIFLELKTVLAMRIFYKDLESLYEEILQILQNQTKSFKSFKIYKSKIEFLEESSSNDSKIKILISSLR
jgi:tRNA(Ile)-lysidine synthetase-like protein